MEVLGVGIYKSLPHYVSEIQAYRITLIMYSVRRLTIDYINMLRGGTK